MASKLSREDVLRVAELARLELDEAEIALFTRQLADILAYAEEVQQADTSGIPPTSHPLTTETLGRRSGANREGGVWREDVPAPSLGRDELLGQAPEADRRAGLIKVPKVL